jgi:hypothetical protein
MTIPQLRRFSMPDDLEGIQRLVSSVVIECYGHLLSHYTFDVTEDWPNARIAESDNEIVGVLLTSHDWVEDLWIEASYRQQGVGTRLLGIAEAEIADRG